MIEILIPVGLGLLGSWMGYALARKGKQWRLYALREADRLRQEGRLQAAVVVLEQALQGGGAADPAFHEEALYRLAGLYSALGRWKQGESVCRTILANKPDLGPSGRHDILRHLARCLEGQGATEERDAVILEADSLIESVPDTAYRLFARQERLVRQGHFPEALLIQEELLREHRERTSVPTLLVVTACTALNAGYPHEALGYATEVLSSPETDYPIRREAYRAALRALAHTDDVPRRGRLAEEFLALAESAKDTRALADARYHAAHARLLLGNLAGAEELASEDDLPLLAALARLRGDVATVEQLLAEDHSPGAALLLAGAYLDAGDGAKALECLDTILPTPDLPEWLTLRRRARRAWALALLGRTDEADPTLPETFPDTETELICREAQAAVLTLQGDSTAKAAFLAHPALAPVFRDTPRLW